VLFIIIFRTLWFPVVYMRRAPACVSWSTVSANWSSSSRILVLTSLGWFSTAGNERSLVSVSLFVVVVSICRWSTWWPANNSEYFNNIIHSDYRLSVISKGLKRFWKGWFVLLKQGNGRHQTLPPVLLPGVSLITYSLLASPIRLVFMC